jgi:hypothetical protein
MPKKKIMKQLITIILCFPFMLMAQNIYTVCNVPGSTSNYKTLQGAHDSVAAGSTLYMLPSSFDYGDVVFTKKLTVYGTGFFLGQNLEPNTQANTAPVYVNSITFRAGSDNSFIEGLQLAFQEPHNTNRIELDTVSNITISRCLILSPNYGAYGGNNSFFTANGANNCLIKQCFIQNINGYNNPPILRYNFGTYPNFSGIQFSNNIFDFQYVGANGLRFGPDNYGGFQPNGTSDVKIINNTFIAALKPSQFGNLSYTNNIFYNSIPSDVVNPAYTYLNGTNINNVTTAPTLFTTVGNNYQNANSDSMFVASLPGFHSIDEKWKLRDTSFANTYGQGGVPVGAIGGASSYKLSGIPNIPFIYSFNVPAQATAPGTISVHIKAHASN